MVGHPCAHRGEPGRHSRQRAVSATATSLLGVLIALFVISRATPAAQSASLEVVAAGFVDPVGVAVDASSTIVVSDRIAGTIVQIAADGSQSILLSGLHRPAGLAFDPAGGLLIAEQGSGRVLRRDPSGALGILAAGINGPRWIAAAGDGMV